MPTRAEWWVLRLFSGNRGIRERGRIGHLWLIAPRSDVGVAFARAKFDSQQWVVVDESEALLAAAGSMRVEKSRHVAQEGVRLIHERFMSAASQYDEFGIADGRMSLLRGGGADEVMIAQNDQRRDWQLAQCRNEIEGRQIAVDMKIAAVSP